MLTACSHLYDSKRMKSKNLTPSLNEDGHQVQCKNLTEYLRKITLFDSVIILGYQNGSHPLCLYRSHKPHTNSMQKLLVSSYAYDPFYAGFISRKKSGLYKSDDIVADQSAFLKKRKRFLPDGAFPDELGLCIELDSNRRIVVFLRRKSIKNAFSPEERRLLLTHFKQLYSLCQQLWPRVWSSRPSAGNNHLANLISYSLSSFGNDALTTREKEVVCLIVQGYNNKTIADALEISVETVKVHRKNIYIKFEVSSMGELFQVFLNHLVLFSSQAVFSHQ